MSAPAVRTVLRAGLVLALSAVAVACDRKPSPPSAPSPVPGATQVTGRERLAWTQDINGPVHSYRAYVDGVAVALSAVQCVDAGSGTECSAPLPAMSDGVHRVAVTAVSDAAGYESERSEEIVLQKISARAASLATALPDAIGDRPSFDPSAGAFDLGLGLTADVVARAVRLPAQLGPLPDGRVLVAEGNGRVRMVHPDEADRESVALEAATLLEPRPAGALALTIDPDFAATRRVFVAYAYRDDSESPRARIVRLREVGDRLGEPAAIFDAALAPETSGASSIERAMADGLRMAFGPDGLLYASPPAGLGFDGQPAASRPAPFVVRLTADGGTPADGALTGVHTPPLAFGWHAASPELLALLEDGHGAAMVQPLGGSPGPADTSASRARFRSEREGAEPVVRFDGLTTAGMRELAPFILDAARALPGGVVRLAVPADLDSIVPGLRGRLGDLVSHDGVIFAVVSDARPGGPAGEAVGVVVRLRP